LIPATNSCTNKNCPYVGEDSRDLISKRKKGLQELLSGVNINGGQNRGTSSSEKVSHHQKDKAPIDQNDYVKKNGWGGNYLNGWENGEQEGAEKGRGGS